MKNNKKVLVTGGAGFIGSEVVRQLIRRSFDPVVADKLTYAADLERLDDCKKSFSFYQADITDARAMRAVFERERPSLVLHLAAETHVDRSIADARPFLRTNLEGTAVLLDLARSYDVKRFLYVSTDEVYGEIARGAFREDFPLLPNSPYAASKAAADLLVRSYIRTYDFPALIVRPSNHYGAWQYPEKFIPVVILKALQRHKIPVYAKGLNVREWLHVSDGARGILEVLFRGKLGESYNLGSGVEKRNIDVVRYLLKIMNRSTDLVEYVKDRPGHDLRYRLTSQKIKKTLGWTPRVTFEEGMQKTVEWYLSHQAWFLKKKVALEAYWRRAYHR